MKKENSSEIYFWVFKICAVTMKNFEKTLQPIVCLVYTVSLDFPRFLSHSVADRLGPCCLFGGMYVTLSFGGLRPLVDGPVG
jgi:hypothetical protein